MEDQKLSATCRKFRVTLTQALSQTAQKVSVSMGNVFVISLNASRALGQSQRGRWHKHNTPEMLSEVAWEKCFSTLGRNCEEQESV